MGFVSVSWWCGVVSWWCGVVTWMVWCRGVGGVVLWVGVWCRHMVACVVRWSCGVMSRVGVVL